MNLSPLFLNKKKNKMKDDKKKRRIKLTSDRMDVGSVLMPEGDSGACLFSQDPEPGNSCFITTPTPLPIPVRSAFVVLFTAKKKKKKKKKLKIRTAVSRQR